MNTDGSTAQERRVVTALFCDVVGSTSHAESMDPEDWTDVVNRTVTVMAACVGRYGGTVTTFAGDAIMAVFGAPVAHEDDPYRAVRAGLSIVDEVASLSREIQRDLGIDVEVRVGINTGLAVTGDVVDSLNVFSALGDTTNVAARMQTLAEPGSVVVAEATYSLVSTEVEVRELGPTDVKGKRESMLVYEVTGVSSSPEGRRGVPGFTSPMVGRDTEFSSLSGIVEADTARGRAVAIVGEPGVGKSRLLAELRAHVATMPDARFVLGRCSSYEEHLPYNLVASLLRALVGVSGSAGADECAVAVTDVAEPVVGEAGTQALLQLLGVVPGQDDDNPDVLQARYASAIGDLLVASATDRRPLVVVCEDVHWSDASSAELLKVVFGRLTEVSIVLGLLTRPDHETHGWAMIEGARQQFGTDFTEVTLQPLPEDDSRVLVANLLEIESLPEGFRKKVLDKAGGNPLFIEEVVRMLVERDLIVPLDGHWTATEEIDGLDVPETLQGLLTSRLDLLPAPAHTAAKVASVIGRRFEARLLDAVLADGPTNGGSPTVQPRLTELEEHGFIKLVTARPQLEFSFRHALIHDVIYGSLLRREARRLHAGVAEALERLHAGQVEGIAPALARHYEHAGNQERAIYYLLMAGRLSLARHAHYEAHDFFASARRLLDDLDSPPAAQRVEAVLGWARAGEYFIPGPESVAATESVLDDAESLDDPDTVARLCLHILKIRHLMGESPASDDYQAVLTRMTPLAPNIADDGLRALLTGFHGQMLRVSEDFEPSLVLLLEAVDGLEAAGRLSDAAWHVIVAADVAATVGRFGEADAWLVRGDDLADRSGDPNMIADVMLIRGKVIADRGSLEEAREHMEQGLALAEESGNIFCTLVGNFFMADQKLRQGDPGAAIPHLEKSSELAAFCNAGPFTMLGQAWLAAARARLGDLDPSEFDQPLAMAQGAGSRLGEGMVRLHRGVTLSTVDPGAALEDLETAESLFEQVGAIPYRARGIHARAMVLELVGRPEEAQALLLEASQLFDELGITPDPLPTA